MNRGQIWWAELGESTASEPGYRRPVVIVQSDDFNRSRINTIIVIPITSNLKLAEAPGNVELLKAKTGLAKDSVANISQIITIDKRFLVKEIGQVDYSTMLQIDEGTRLVLSL